MVMVRNKGKNEDIETEGPSFEQSEEEEFEGIDEEVEGKTTEEKLEDLQQMKEKGLISEEDFEEKKEDILEEY